jgi:hypothetical protein
MLFIPNLLHTVGQIIPLLTIGKLIIKFHALGTHYYHYLLNYISSSRRARCMPENHPSVFQPLQLKDCKSSGFIKLRVTTIVNIPIARCINANLIFQKLSVNLQGKSHFKLPMLTYECLSWGMSITDELGYHIYIYLHKIQ